MSSNWGSLQSNCLRYFTLIYTTRPQPKRISGATHPANRRRKNYSPLHSQCSCQLWYGRWGWALSTENCMRQGISVGVLAQNH